jgi:hypothetical protein
METAISEAAISSGAVFTVANGGTTSLFVTGITPNNTWLSASPTAFTLAPGNSQTVIVSVNLAGLTAGTHNADLVVDSNDADATVSVTLDLEADQPVPVELSTFTAANVTGGVLIQWHTGSEYQNLGFNLYRSEMKDSGYRKIAWIEGAGSTPVGQDYQFTDTDVRPGQTYYYYIEDIDFVGVSTKSTPISAHVETRPGQRSDVISVRVQPPPLVVEKILPLQFRLRQNFPNPFNPETWLPYELPKAADVRMTIFDVRGQVVRTLTVGKQRAGYYVDKEKAVHWDGRNETGERVGSGVYFYRVDADEFSAIRRMVILK